MKHTLLDISGRIDPPTIAVLQQMNAVAGELGVPLLLVGATARDMVMHHGYGAAVQRATEDMDFAIQVADWAVFEAMMERLVAVHGFHRTQAVHRLRGSNGAVVDLVPFGGIASADARIAWPPDHAVVMNVLGFDEALAHAMRVRIQHDPVLDMPVPTPAGMVLLKLLAWADRDATMRRKDARDVAYLLAGYGTIPAIEDGVYENHALGERYGWDIALAAAHQLGQGTAGMASAATAAAIGAVLKDRARLLEEMADASGSSEALLEAFEAGFGSRPG